mgnify:CR=1 FL=1
MSKHNPTILDAVHSLVPGAMVAERNGVLEWQNPSTPPVTNEQLQTELIRLQEVYQSTVYQNNTYSVIKIYDTRK